MGSASVDRTVDTLLNMEVPVQIMLAAGNNKKMIERFADSQKIRTLPFTEDYRALHGGCRYHSR